MTGKIKRTTKSGWCISGKHTGGDDTCEGFYLKQSYSQGCGCSCHGVDKKASKKVDSEDDE